mmetsp:Transcript_17516/g.26360  ORF Transcript_17516/g.26360 Transcript_17516/m.26360 type:complete len:86 (+) Transcript_17516:1076-1333(+)
MAGVKDDPHNLANAVFTNKYGNMKSEFEAVLNRRTVTLQIEANIGSQKTLNMKIWRWQRSCDRWTQSSMSVQSALHGMFTWEKMR